MASETVQEKSAAIDRLGFRLQQAQEKMNLFAENKPFQLVWDATSLTAFKACPRRYRYMMLDKIARVGRSIHLEWGIALHQALEAYHKAKASGFDFRSALHKAIRQAISAELPETDDSTKTKLTLVRTVIWYLDQYRNDPAKTYILADGSPAVELSFKFFLTEVAGHQVYWAGHIDRIVEYHDQLWFMDYKTTKSQLTQRYFAGFSPSIQMFGYKLAGEVAFSTPVVGGIVDAIQVGATFARFGRHLLHISAEQLEEWLESATFYLNLAYECAETESWPMNETSCNEFFGCPYRELCSRPESQRSFFLNDYEPFEWDPTKER